MEEQIAIYETGAKAVRFNFDTENETIWATQAQMADLFGVTPQNITLHLKRVFQDGELEKNRTCKEFLQVQTEGGREVTRKAKVYNLDAIISIGYRVNSRKATDFRIWATKILHDHIVKGVTVNEQRLGELSAQRLAEINSTLDVVRRLMAQNQLMGEEANGVLEIITQYANTFRTLKEYDEGFLRLEKGKKARVMLEAGDCIAMIDQLREAMQAGEMFGKLRGDAFEGILRTIDQSFGGKEMYPSVAEKAANLLYFIIKDHPFFDGNKRIAALLFIAFLTLNKDGLLKNGEPKISDRALVALTLMIAESEPREKGLMTAIVCRLLEE